MALDPDILERINADFPPEDRQHIIDALSAAHRNGRITRCILFAAKGSIQRIRELLASADLDDRDVISAGEYDLNRRVRDLRVSFLINSPVDFWISQLAITAYKYGYNLTNLKTHAVSTPPFAAIQTEGTAMFTKDGRTFTIHKHAGQWSIYGIGCNLATFGLDSPLGDEERFRIQLDYLLSRIIAEQMDAMNPRRQHVAVSLTAAILRLDAILKPWGFAFTSDDNQSSHCGPFASGHYCRDTTRIGISCRDTIDNLYYEHTFVTRNACCTESEQFTIGHSTLMDALGHSDDCRCFDLFCHA